MRIIYVHGDDDFAAVEWERLSKKLKIVLLKKLKKNGDEVAFGDGCYATLLEFGDVDPAFIEFIMDKMIDYDYAKNANFYMEPFL